jgi:hypothetical protein
VGFHDHEGFTTQWRIKVFTIMEMDTRLRHGRDELWQIPQMAAAVRAGSGTPDAYVISDAQITRYIFQPAGAERG